MRLALALGELEQIERPFDVDMMSRHRRELRARGQQRGEMEDAIDFELGEDAIQQAHVGDRAGELARHLRRQRGIERAHVDGDDRDAWRRQPGDQAVTDFAACAGNEKDWLSHLRNSFVYVLDRSIVAARTLSIERASSLCT